jgi:cationic amino acid transporter 1
VKYHLNDDFFSDGLFILQPRILMAMARDGLLPSFFSKLNEKTSVPVNSTLVSGFVAALLAFFMDVSQLAGMVSSIVFHICHVFYIYC